VNVLVGQIYTDRPDVTVLRASLTPVSNPASDGMATSYNAYIPDLVSRYQSLRDRIRFADMCAAFGSDTSLMSDDGIHPSTVGYDRMAQTWYDALTTAPEPHVAVSMSCGFLMLFLSARIARPRAARSEESP
jgi:lysophospholipase L1-like esterase